MLLATEPQPRCLHCGLAIARGLRFCCAGCESVHELLVEKGLAHFYTLRDQYSFRKPEPAPLPITEADAALDQDLGNQARFYLEGIHCLGCLWLLEKLPEIDPRIRAAKLDIAHQLLEVEIHPAKIDWNEVLRLVRRLGYSATPITASGTEGVRRRSLRRDLLRIGVAAFCAGNIMLLSVSVYGGTDLFWGLRFGWLSFFLALPTLTFSAWPLYKSALYPLRHGKISVDLAICLALLAGTAMSLWSLAGGSQEQVYFDSLTMLVFLLLSSRYLLARFRESLAKEKTFLSFLGSERYARLRPRAERVKAESLAAGDEIRLGERQTLPVDGVLLAGPAYFDFSLLTGESEPVKVLAGDAVEAGAKLRSEAAPLRVERPLAESRLARILDQIRAYRLNRSPTLDFADRVGRYFVLVVLALAAGLLAVHPDREGLRRALALVIVTCPCVLAFAVPLALTRAMQLAARRGILFRSADKLEALAEVRDIFFDKTGTLTNGQFEVLEWEQISGPEAETKAAAAALERRCAHPAGKAIVRHVGPAEDFPVEGFALLPGQGVSGSIGGRPWKVIRAAQPKAGRNVAEVFCDGRLRARVTMGDAIRPEAAEVLRGLRSQGLRAAILSGDHDANAALVAGALGIPAWTASLLPEDKARIVARVPRSAMVGDGANDAVAFQGATVGIAVQGAVDISLRNADVALTRPGLAGVAEAILAARAAMRIVRLNFGVTLAYNVLAGALALAGLMQPLWAAVLMPMSALSVFILTQWQTRRAG